MSTYIRNMRMFYSAPSIHTRLDEIRVEKNDDVTYQKTQLLGPLVSILLLYRILFALFTAVQSEQKGTKKNGF